MKKILFFSFLFCFKLSFGQSTKSDTSFYDNGKPQWTGQTILKKTFPDSGYQRWGICTEWYQTGQMKSVIKYDTTYPYENFIDYWQADGQQTIKEGNGIYTLSGIDSSIYIVKDSSFNGFCKSYYHFYNSYVPWKLWATGNYENGKRIGEWTFRDSSGANDIVMNFENGIAHGQCSFYYLNSGIISESGYLDDCKRIGIWKKFDKQGNLSGEYNYLNGQKMGDCILYYPDGKIKAKGQYKQIRHFFKGKCEDPNNPGVFLQCNYWDEHVPTKTGMWYFYDENGKIINTKTYKDKIEEREYCSQIW